MKGNDFSFGFTDRFFNLRFKLKFFFSILLSVFSGGEKCLCCNKFTVQLPLCRKCLKNLSDSAVSPYSENSCRICGKPLVSEIELCSACRNSPVLKSPDGVFPLFAYRLWKKNLLFSWKILENRSLSPFLAFLVNKKLSELEEKHSEKLCIVPVPPRPGKIRQKGWDQIEELCFFLHKGWKRKIIRLLRRNSKTQQKKLDREQRLETIGNSYSLIGESKLKKVSVPETVVLLDDVLTTGSTVENCAALLKKGGVKKVLVITLFVVD